MDGRTSRCNFCRNRLTVTQPRCPHCYAINPHYRKPHEKIKISKTCLGNGRQHSESLNKALKLTGSSSSSSSSVRQKKRALLCGVSYKGQQYKLKGPFNDVKRMRELLVETYNFPEESICVLTEQEPIPAFTPTRKNIQNALKWLVDGSQAGDLLVFYFSGHGSQQPDFNGDELDGFDETICPVDFRQAGMIIDNDINSTIVQPLKPGVTLHAFVDACHSGTILDLLYIYDQKKKQWVDNIPPSGVNKATSGGLAICFGACEDDQLADDTTAIFGKEKVGAMTYSLINAIRSNPMITYGGLLESMHKAFDQANIQAGCLKNRVLERVFNMKSTQEPQLSSSEPFDIYSKVFKL